MTNADDMRNLEIGRIINTSSDQNRIRDGIVLTINSILPTEWADGDSIDINFADGSKITLFAERQNEEIMFSYKYDHYSTWLISLEEIGSNEQGKRRFRVNLSEAHKDIQRADDEAGR